MEVADTIVLDDDDVPAPPVVDVVELVDDSDDDSDKYREVLGQLERDVLPALAHALSGLRDPFGGPQKKRKGNSAKKAKTSDGWAKGTGFGGSKNTTVGRSKAEKQAEKAQEAADSELARSLAAVTRALTCPVLKGVEKRDEDKEMHAVFSPLLKSLKESHLAGTLSVLLRNDSLLDVNSRQRLYEEVFTLLETIAKAPNLAYFLGTALDSEEDDESQITNLNALLQQLAKQASTYLQYNHAAVHDPTAELCRGMVDTSERVSMAISVATDRGLFTVDAVARKRRRRKRGRAEEEDVTLLADASPELQAEYLKVLRALRFASIPMLDRITNGGIGYTYRAHIHTSVVGSAKKRMVRIASEISSLQTCLPVEYGSSIFLRTDEDHMDILKALIIGPEDTPYANGCFEFDIYLPADYPSSPPKVTLVTTGKGRVRFNPNLYNCGKVCLSLLGTWQGPGWDPEQSTLLQVLISIQSLIMVPDPFFNEPGFQAMLGTARGDQASKEYNQSVREATVRHAMIDMALDRSNVFAKVIQLHFTMKRTQILAQLENWVAASPVSPQRSQYSGSGLHSSRLSMRNAVTDLTNALQTAASLSEGSSKKPIVL